MRRTHSSVRPTLTTLLLAAVGLWAAACGSTTATTTSTPAKSSSQQSDAHIGTYGEPAPEPEKREIAILVNRYYTAAAAGDGATACRLLSPSLAKSIPEDYGGPPGSPRTREETCPVVIAKVLKHNPAEPFADLQTTKITGVRLNPNGNEAFVQLSSKHIPTGEIFVQRESGAWKIGVPIGRACTDCAA